MAIFHSHNFQLLGNARIDWFNLEVIATVEVFHSYIRNYARYLINKGINSND